MNVPLSVNNACGIYSNVLDTGVFHYYHPQIERSGVVYVNERKIELLEKNRMVERREINVGDYTLILDTVKDWVFKT